MATLFPMLANHQIKHQATSKMVCHPSDCWWPLESSSGVCVGMYRLTYSLHPQGYLMQELLLKLTAFQSSITPVWALTDITKFLLWLSPVSDTKSYLVPGRISLRIITGFLPAGCGGTLLPRPGEVPAPAAPAVTLAEEPLAWAPRGAAPRHERYA